MDAVKECNRRAKDVFSVLDGFEKRYQDYLATPESAKSANDLLRFDLSEEISRKRKNPDSEEPTLELAPARETKKGFIRDPSKWTEYSLEDVTEEQMSDGACRRAAFEFLRSRGVILDAVEEKGEVGDKIVFGAAVKKNQETKKNKEALKPNPNLLSFADLVDKYEDMFKSMSNINICDRTE